MAARDLPNLGLTAGYDPGENGWGDDMTLNLLKLSVLSQGTVINKVAAEPGAPAAGDTYILDETHATHPNEVIVFDGPVGEEAWVYIVPNEGWLIYNQTANYYEQFNGVSWSEFAGGGGGGGSAVYTIPMGATTTPTGGEILLLHVFAEAISFLDDFAEATSYVGTNPTTNPYVIDVKKNGVSVGSVSITSAGVVTFSTSGGTVDFASGDRLSLHAPAVADATIANLALTFRGYRP